jgi:uncharacterized membrane protein YgdD (TMEM256/DUF423 family)
MSDVILFLAGLNGAVGVAAGAYAAHGAAPASAELLRTGSSYQMWHALALLAVALFLDRSPGVALRAAGWLFVFGVLLFSGSLYGLAFQGPRWLGRVAPIGGLALILGWLALCVAALRR